VAFGNLSLGGALGFIKGKWRVSLLEFFYLVN